MAADVIGPYAIPVWRRLVLSPTVLEGALSDPRGGRCRRGQQQDQNRTSRDSGDQPGHPQAARLGHVYLPLRVASVLATLGGSSVASQGQRSGRPRGFPPPFSGP